MGGPFSASIDHAQPAEAAAISDALLRAVLGLDTNDLELFTSAWVSEGNACFEMDGKPMNGIDEITNMFKFIGPLDTQHFISNIRIDMKDGPDKAYMTAYAWAQHHQAGEGVDPTTKHLTSGSRYFIDLKKSANSGTWVMKKWSMTIVWLDGDASIVGQ